VGVGGRVSTAGRPAWAEGQIGIEELRDFLEAHGLRVLDVTWPEGAKRPLAVLTPGGRRIESLRR